jgi:hypothetical protein
MEQRLEPGDRVAIGSVEFRVEASASAAATKKDVAAKPVEAAAVSPIGRAPDTEAAKNSKRQDKPVAVTARSEAVGSASSSDKQSDKKSAAARVAPLALFARFFRSTPGAATVGLALAVVVVLYWLALIPPPPQENTEAPAPVANENSDRDWLRSILVGNAADPNVPLAPEKEPPALPEEAGPDAVQPKDEPAPPAPEPFRARRHSHRDWV